MDSLTQIVLGAAVGEAVLGKKLGNKALLWGAVAGTIPDLDVLSKLFVDDLTANEWHRGFSHSILFCLMASPILAWLIHKKERATLFVIILSLVAFLMAFSSGWIMSGIVLIFAALLVWAVLRMKLSNTMVHTKELRKFFFLCLVTHPLLDAHTSWGTQLLWPLPWKYSWNNIFVVDPLYTVPFMLCLIAVMFFNREHAWRRTLNWLGISISSAYMVFTIVMKFMALSDFKRSLSEKNIDYEDISTRPTPLNCILWTANVDVGDAYLMAYHSFFDTQAISWYRVEKNHDLLGDLSETDEVNRLWHLTAGEYAVTLRQDTVVYNDLRFGMFGEPSEKQDFVFAYKVFRAGDEVKVQEIPPPRPNGEEGRLAMNELWQRIKGN